jgi:quinol monooxygenase YgiN
MMNMTKTFAVATAALAGTAAMAQDTSDDIAVFATLQVEEANLSTFEDILGRIGGVVANEPGTLVYDYARAGATVYTYQRYADAAAYLAHLENNAPLHEELFAVAPVTSLVALTDVPDPVRPMYEQMGAVFATPISGE